MNIRSFLQVFIAYQFVFSRLWRRKNIGVLLIGFLYAAGIFLLCYYIYQYETILTDWILNSFNNLLDINIRQALYGHYIMFMLEIFCYRTCLLVFLMSVFHFLLIILLLPIVYIAHIYILRRIIKTGIVHPSWKGLGATYKTIYLFMLRHGMWVVLYLFVSFLFSFIPYVGIVCVVASMFVSVYYAGILCFDMSKRFCRFRFLDKKEFRAGAQFVGAMIAFTFLAPIVGWFFLPILHMPALMHYYNSVANINE